MDAVVSCVNFDEVTMLPKNSRTRSRSFARASWVAALQMIAMFEWEDYDSPKIAFEMCQ